MIGMTRTGSCHIRYVQDGQNHTKIVCISDFKSIDGIKKSCDRMRRKFKAEAFEVAFCYDRHGATIYKIVLEYVNSRWIKRRY
jgi:hypothetical protein